MIAVQHALSVFQRHDALKNIKNAIDVGGARKVWLEGGSPRRHKWLLRLRYELARLMRLDKIRPPQGVVVADNPFISLIPGLKMLELGYNTETLATGTDIICDFLDHNAVASLENSFDLTISFDTLEHISNPWLFCNHLVNVTKSGGYIYVATVFLWNYHPCPNDYYRYSPDGLRECFRGTRSEIIEYGWDEPDVSVYAFLRKMSYED